MLVELKKAINEHRVGEFTTEVMLEKSASIKDVFLDDPDAVVIGAENDPEIAKLVKDIPAYEEDDDEEIKEEIKAMTEGLIGTEFKN